MCWNKVDYLEGFFYHFPVIYECLLHIEKALLNLDTGFHYVSHLNIYEK